MKSLILATIVAMGLAAGATAAFANDRTLPADFWQIQQNNGG